MCQSKIKYDILKKVPPLRGKRGVLIDCLHHKLEMLEPKIYPERNNIVLLLGF